MKKAIVSTIIVTVYRQAAVAFVATMALSALLAAQPAAAKEKMANPDFTRGDKIPDRRGARLEPRRHRSPRLDVL